MSTLPTRSKDQIVATIAAGMQGRVTAFLNFAVGSVLLAFAEAQAGVALWLQALVIQVLRLTRAATSNGDDLDTWVADYGLVRSPAVAATGTVTFGRYTAAPTYPVIPVGTNVKSTDGSMTFVVVASSDNVTYSAAQNGYIMDAGLATVDVPVACLIAGAAGNVQAGTISLIASSVPGVDLVNNGSPFTNGSDGETDPALRSRFVDYLQSLSKATKAAIGFAIESLQLGLDYTITETIDFDGRGTPGFFVVVDDGTGLPPSALITQARAAVDAIRAAGVRYSVSGPVRLPAALSLHVTANPGYDITLVEAAVSATLANYINGLGLGHPLLWSRLIQVAYDASPGVASVSGLTINGSTNDLTASPSQTIKCAGVIVG